MVSLSPLMHYTGHCNAAEEMGNLGYLDERFGEGNVDGCVFRNI